MERIALILAGIWIMGGAIFLLGYGAMLAYQAWKGLLT